MGGSQYLYLWRETKMAQMSDKRPFVSPLSRPFSSFDDRLPHDPIIVGSWLAKQARDPGM